MEALSKLSERLRHIAETHGPAAFHDAEVLAVDPDTWLCDISLEGEAVIYDVRLRAVQSTNSSIDVLPEVGAAVVVGKMGDDDYLVIACDKIQQYKVTTASTIMQLDAEGVLISKGDETLKKILTEMVDLILQVYAPKNVPGLNQLKTRINSLLK